MQAIFLEYTSLQRLPKKGTIMKDLPTIKDLLEAGVHFGHQTKRWNPKMSKYIFTEKNDIHIIDLFKTLEKLAAAVQVIETTVANGGDVLFVGTKRQAQEVVEQIAKDIDVSYVTNRWVGGLLTNFTITKKNINKMLDIEGKLVTGFENRTKQEVLLIKKELERLQRLYSGVRSVNKKPALIVLADPKHEKIVIREAHKLNIPIVAVVDTNCDPDEVTYPIPGNDDAIRAITLFFSCFAEAVKEGRVEATKKKAEAAKSAPKPVVKIQKPVTAEKETKTVKAEEKPAKSETKEKAVATKKPAAKPKTAKAAK